MARLRVRFDTDWEARRASARFLEEWAAVAEKWGARGVKVARIDWPVDTGRSLKGWTHTVEVRGQSVALTVLNPVNYAPFVHERGVDTPRVVFIEEALTLGSFLDSYADEVADAAVRAFEAG